MHLSAQNKGQEKRKRHDKSKLFSGRNCLQFKGTDISRYLLSKFDKSVTLFEQILWFLNPQF